MPIFGGVCPLFFFYRPSAKRKGEIVVAAQTTTGATFAIAGLILLCVGLKRLVLRKNAENRYMRCQAVMSGEVERKVFGRLVLFDPVMTYQVGEITYVAHIRTGDAGSIHQKGGHYSLLCSPDNPEHAMFELDRADTIIMRCFLVCGVLLLLVGECITLFL